MRQAELLDDLGRWAWRQWRATVDLEPGEHEIAVRAWDSSAATQPRDPALLWNPKGYCNNAQARITVHGRMSHEADVTRRTWLANERTYLAWWRTGLTTLTVALAAARVVPELSRPTTAGRTRSIGAAYALLGTAVHRLRRAAPA